MNQKVAGSSPAERAPKSPAINHVQARALFSAINVGFERLGIYRLYKHAVSMPFDEDRA
jgi:hypothetical protein